MAGGVSKVLEIVWSGQVYACIHIEEGRKKERKIEKIGKYPTLNVKGKEDLMEHQKSYL